MPYVGNQLAGSFVSSSFTSQTITGNGSTSYTLDQSVVNGRELLVYINNVKQEEGSGKSYTASGTTITFSEAVQSGDSCYILFFGQTKQTVEPPQGSIRSNMFANDNLTIPKTLTITDGDVVVASGHGIDFSATANSGGTMSSELLNDYEEGIFTPILADATSGGNTASVSPVLGDYTKIGNLVFVSIACANINTSGLTSGNTIIIRGLPFTSLTRTSPANISQHLVVRCDRINVASDCFGVAGIVGSGATHLQINQNRDNVGDESLKVSAITATDNSSDIFVTGCYLAD